MYKRRAISIICSIVLVIMFSLSVSALQPQPEKGDLNGDDRSDSSDLVILRQYLIGEEDNIYTYGADMNSDDNIDSQDYSLFRREILRISDSFIAYGSIIDADTGAELEDIVIVADLLYREDLTITNQYGNWSVATLTNIVNITPIKQGYTFEPQSREVTISNPNNNSFRGKKSVDENKVINFTDPNLEQSIREKINIPTGNIYQRDVLNLEKLDLSNKNISSIEGIQNLVNLKELSLAYNQIKELKPISRMTDIVKLNLQGNGIEDIDALEYLYGLNELILGDNNIEDISPLTNLIQIDVLELDNNLIKDIKPLYYISYEKLNLSNNEIQEINYGFLREDDIQELYLDNNQISDLSLFSHMAFGDVLFPNLTTLSLNNNQINSLDRLSGLANLNYLRLAGNKITDISEVVHLETLNEFDINNNDLDISEGSETMIIISDLINNGCEVSYKPQH